ncbi:MAG: hypothetical protein ACKVPY_15770 [Paracoccaceae bacterium]
MTLSEPVEVGAFPFGGLRRNAAIRDGRQGYGAMPDPGGWTARTGAMAARMLAAPVLKGAAEPRAWRAAWRWLEDATIAATVAGSVPVSVSFAVSSKGPVPAGITEGPLARPGHGDAPAGTQVGLPLPRAGAAMVILPAPGGTGTAGARTGRARLSDFVLPALFIERALVLALYDGPVLEVETRLFAVALPAPSGKRLPLPVVVWPPQGFYLFAKPLPPAGAIAAPAPGPLPGGGGPFAAVLLAALASTGAIRRGKRREI